MTRISLVASHGFENPTDKIDKQQWLAELQRERRHLRATRHAESLILEVLDGGPGIPEGAEERIFERFYRAGGASEGNGPGIGLGLTVSRGLIEAHGGTLVAGRREGGGAVFRLTLPLEVAPTSQLTKARPE